MAIVFSEPESVINARTEYIEEIILLFAFLMNAWQNVRMARLPMVQG